MDKFTQVVSAGGGYDAWDNYSAKKQYHYLNGTWDEYLFTPTPMWVENAPLDYIYTSHPLDFGGDNYLSNPYPSFYDDGQMVGTTGPHILLSDESLIIDMAIQFYNHQDEAYEESIDNALNNVTQLINCYENDSVPGGGSFSEIDEISDSPLTELLVYPNPSKTILYIDGLNQKAKYSIYTLQGQLIEENRFDHQIGIAHLPNGFYFLQIITRDNEYQWTGKFVKQ